MLSDNPTYEILTLDLEIAFQMTLPSFLIRFYTWVQETGGVSKI